MYKNVQKVPTLRSINLNVLNGSNVYCRVIIYLRKNTTERETRGLGSSVNQCPTVHSSLPP